MQDSGSPKKYTAECSSKKCLIPFSRMLFVWFWGPCNGKVILFCATNQTHSPLLFFFVKRIVYSESKITELERAFRCHLAQPPVTVSCIVCRPSFCRSFSEILIVCDDPLRSNFLTIYFLTDFFFPIIVLYDAWLLLLLLSFVKVKI